MRINIPLSGKTLYTVMRSLNYSPAYSASANESAFQRILAGREYPKFHVYCTLSDDKKSATLNLHLDQKKPSYTGSHTHNAEHSGPVVEAEAARILSIAEAKRNKF